MNDGQDPQKAEIFDLLRQPDFVSDLEDWAGKKIFQRGEEYFRKKRVANLAVTGEGRLLGDVKGTRQYIAALYLDEDGDLVGDCTCPYDDICKHIVALALAAREDLLENKNPPVCDTADFRPGKLFSRESDHPVSMSALRERLVEMSKEDLLDLLIKACDLDGNILLLCATRADPDNIGVQAILNEASKAIAEAAVVPDYEYAYSANGDYAAIAKKLRAIIAAGKPEEALELAEEVFDTCDNAIEFYDQEGEMIEDVAQVSEAGMEALREARWPLEKKLIWSLKVILEDQFGYCDCFEDFLNGITDTEAWARADEYLKSMEPAYSDSWRISRIIDLRKLALAKSGRDEELLRLYESQAKENGEYLKLVDYLLNQGDYNKAEKWIYKGLKKPRYPYEANVLREKLIGIREKEGNLDAVIALRAELFVDSPDTREYDACANAAKAAGKWEALRPLLLLYLTDGKLPWSDKTWPCENKGLIPAGAKKFPLYTELAEIAIHENRPLDALKWHDLQRKNKGGFGIPESRLADAIKDVAPERAFAIWQKEVENLIAETKASSYYQAGKYLEKMIALAEKKGDKNRWLPYLHSLGEKHKRKKNFIKVLDVIKRGEKLTERIFH